MRPRRESTDHELELYSPASERLFFLSNLAIFFGEEAASLTADALRVLITKFGFEYGELAGDSDGRRRAGATFLAFPFAFLTGLAASFDGRIGDSSSVHKSMETRPCDLVRGVPARPDVDDEELELEEEDEELERFFFKLEL